jgi:hypothetical protein
MSSIGINKHNVGRIAERIVSNELEYRGFRVSDLNKEGISANADILAAKDGKTWQIQVKGATWENGPWVHYGYCSEEIMAGRKPAFNAKADGFYRAEIVALVCVKSPAEYTCVILPVKQAEKAAQLNLDYAYRTPKRSGAAKKAAGPIWVEIRYVPNTRDQSKRQMMEAEQAILEPYIDNWEFCGTTSSAENPARSTGG